MKRDEPETALADINNLLRQHPENARALNLRGVIYGMMGRTNEAISDLNASTALTPLDPTLWNNIGFYKFRQGNYQGAKADFMKALELDPQFVSARNNLAQADDRMSQPMDMENYNSYDKEKPLKAH